VLFELVIPGRTEGANPESRCMHCADFWIPGSPHSRRPGMTLKVIETTLAETNPARVIPGRTEGANPESRCMYCADFWIPGSPHSRRPGMTAN